MLRLLSFALPLNIILAGVGILHELLQNADDAGATEVSILLDCAHYPSDRVLSESLAPWQGPALYFANDSIFSEADLRNIATVGQGSKLDAAGATGRFGLGFNSVYHFTDVPAFVTGGHFVMFDPHTEYIPQCSAAQPGIKVRLPTRLADDFPDQVHTSACVYALGFCILTLPVHILCSYVELYLIILLQFAPFSASHFAVDLSRPYPGTVFRFALRGQEAAARSKIMPHSHSPADVKALLTQLLDEGPEVCT